MKKLIYFAVNLVVTTLSALVLRILIIKGISQYVANFNFYSFILELIGSLIIAFVIFLLYVFIFRLILRNAPILLQAVITGILSAFVFYLLGVFGNGYTITFRMTMDTIKGLLVILIAGFVFPFFRVWSKRVTSNS